MPPRYAGMIENKGVTDDDAMTTASDSDRPDSHADAPRPLRIALAQLTSGPDVDENLAAVTALIAEAAERGARLVVFPEATMACFGSRLSEVAEPLDGPFACGVRAAAASAGVIAVAGIFTPAGGGRVHNTLLITGPGIEASYHKIHLYDAFGSRESETVSPGASLVSIDALGTRIGFATCYDLRFADQFTDLGRRGARLVVVPASWGDGPGKDQQWDVLTRARAMDAQAYLAACDQAWTPPQGVRPLGIGLSRVADPFGTIVGQLDERAGLLVVDIDLARVDAARRQLPILAG